MGLLQFFKRNTGPTDDSVESQPSALPDAVAAARARARRRLIGATVLLAAGVIGFPLLFETQPRPVAVNIPIEIPRKDGAPPLAPPPAPTSVVVPATAAPVAASAAPIAVAKADIVEKASEQGRELPAAKPTAAPLVAPVPVPVPTKPVASVPAATAKPAPSKAAVPAPEAKPEPKAPAKPAAKPVDDAAAARARALLDGQSPPAAAASAAARVVVQVGAFTDAHKIAEVRSKLEKTGLKTYTQVIEADGAKRTRIRVGPFATRAEADKAAARIKAAGLPAAILTL